MSEINKLMHCRIILKYLCLLIILPVMALIAGCDRDETVVTFSENHTGTQQSTPGNSDNVNPASDAARFNITNKRYFFDVSDHTAEELQALLMRIEEITEASPETFDKLEIVMILHGPDIGLFTQSNYEQNQQLIDLAAKLDAFNVVDMKVCETAMNSLGVNPNEIPPFIESVPYAPAEIERLQQEGYISL